MSNITTPQGSFSELGIAPKLLEILQNNKFTVPTPIQQQAIPHAIQGKDVMGIAQTGTGKTLAFGVPMIQRLAQNSGKQMGLVVLPTRELALQVDATLKKIGQSIGLRTAILIGGESMPKQIKALSLKPHIIIATPGRLIDHLEGGRLKLDTISVLVLDEADRMLDMGFAPQLKKILQRVPKERQTMLFSATMPDEIVNIAKSYMHLPLRVEVAPAGTAVETVSQEVFFVNRDEKASLLKNILAQYKDSVLVFSRTKHGAKKIAQIVRNIGHTATEIHSNRSLKQRLEALDGFKIGKYRVLVATDIAARGIDVKGLNLVVNYDLPDNPEDYVHRIGRTGRAGMTGHAISFATFDQRRDVNQIERLIRKGLAISKTPQLEKSEPIKSDYSDSRSERKFTGPRSEAGRERFPKNHEHARGHSERGPREFKKKEFSRGGFKRNSSSDKRGSRNNSRKPVRRDTESQTAGAREDSFYMQRKPREDKYDQF